MPEGEEDGGWSFITAMRACRATLNKDEHRERREEDEHRRLTKGEDQLLEGSNGC
jgi:hypothetical protein